MDKNVIFEKLLGTNLPDTHTGEGLWPHPQTTFRYPYYKIPGLALALILSHLTSSELIWTDLISSELTSFHLSCSALCV